MMSISLIAHQVPDRPGCNNSLRTAKRAPAPGPAPARRSLLQTEYTQEAHGTGQHREMEVSGQVEEAGTDIEQGAGAAGTRHVPVAHSSALRAVVNQHCGRNVASQRCEPVSNVVSDHL